MQEAGCAAPVQKRRVWCHSLQTQRLTHAYAHAVRRSNGVSQRTLINTHREGYATFADRNVTSDSLRNGEAAFDWPIIATIITVYPSDH